MFPTPDSDDTKNDSNAESDDTQELLNKAEASDDKTSQEIDALPSWAQEMIRELRAEAKERRIALKKEQEEAKRRDQERLAQQGQWRELAEQRETELKNMQGYKDRAEALESMLRESNKSRIDKIPDDMRAIVPVEYSPEQLSAWLDANVARLMKPTAPSLDGGAAGSSSSSQIVLSDEEKRIAQATGVSFEDYAKYKAKIAGKT